MHGSRVPHLHGTRPKQSHSSIQPGHITHVDSQRTHTPHDKQTSHVTHDTQISDSSSSKPKLLQRQSRIPDTEAGVTAKEIKTKQCSTPETILDTTKQPADITKLEYLQIPPKGTTKGFIKGERQSIVKTQLVDAEGNLVIPDRDKPHRKLPSAPTARVKYPGIIVDRSPSGVDPLDTNEFYKYRSRTIQEKEIKDYRHDSGETLIINEIDDQKSVKPNVLDISYDRLVDEYAYNTINTSLTAKNDTIVPVINVEEIQLKDIESSGNSGSKISDYKIKFKERIRLKNTSQKSRDGSLDKVDSYKLGDNNQTIDGENVDSRKTVAFKELPSLSASSNKARSEWFEKPFVDDSNSTNRAIYAADHKGISEPKLLSVEPKLPAIVASKSQSRLHNQSSTETSGLGETVTSGCSSQESIPGYYSVTGIETNLYEDQGIDLSDDDDTRSTLKEGNGTLGKGIIDRDNIINHTNEIKEGGNLQAIIVDGITCTAIVHTAHQSQYVGNELPGTSYDFTGEDIAELKMKEKGNIQIPTDTFKVRAYRPPPDFIGRDVKKPDTLRVHSVNVGPNFDELFTQSKKLTQQQTVGLRLDQINNEWNKQQRGSSIKSRSSQGSFRSRAGSTRRSKRFLSHKESQWMQWGAERRASYRRRMEKLEKPEPEIPRASTPVKKARQEGLVFIHPDLESNFISEEDINYINRHKHERLKTYKLIEKSKLKHHHEAHDINRLTAGELMTLSGFWEHRVFCRSRYISILLSLATTVIYILSICSTQWVTYPSPDIPNSYAREGLWFKCSPVLNDGRIDERCGDPTGRGTQRPHTSPVKPTNHSNYTVSRDFESSLWESYCWKLEPLARPLDCVEKLHNWQTAVIGLMIFSAAFGFVAAVLGICGVCTSPLPKKIYYFHSAGEIFFVCALSTTIALIIYAVAISMDTSVESHSYGTGYGLGWGGTAFFFAASFCMSLDELVRESAQNKCCRYICWKSRNSDDDDSHPV